MRRFLKTLWRDESGMAAIEYALLLALIAAALATAANGLGDAVLARINNACISLGGTC
jgi:Flp pilus assembly pilin Flp